VKSHDCCANRHFVGLPIKCANRNFAQMCESQLCSNVRIATLLAFRSNVRIATLLAFRSNVRIATLLQRANRNFADLLLKCANRNFAPTCESQLCWTSDQMCGSNMSILHNHGTGRATGAVCRHHDDSLGIKVCIAASSASSLDSIQMRDRRRGPLPSERALPVCSGRTAHHRYCRLLTLSFCGDSGR
jgi:hypothetical protein